MRFVDPAASSAISGALAAFLLVLPQLAFAQKPPTRVDDPTTPGPVKTSPTTGAVVVVSGVDGARVQLFSLARGGRAVPKATRMADGEGNVSFSSLRPGAYRVVVSTPEHDDAREDVVVVAGRPETVTGRPRPRFGYLVLTGAEIADGTLIEVDGKEVDPARINRDPDGSARIKVSLGKHEVRVLKPGFELFVAESEILPGGEALVAVNLERQLTSVVIKGAAGTRVYVDGAPGGVIPLTGEVEIRRLLPGQSYDLRFELEDHQPLMRSVRAEAGTKALVEAALEPLPTSGPFEDIFRGSLAAWDAPDTWEAANGVLTVRGEHVGIARESWYRDFDMVFALRLVSPRGAAWTVRARDGKNYYLFVLGGPEGRFPNQLRTYVVLDGAFDPEAPASTLPIFFPLRLDETYHVRVHGEGSVIQHWLKPASAGEEVSIGLFNDVKRAFALGRIGFVAPFGESFQISGLSVRPARNP
jgi:hypothetical protein